MSIANIAMEFELKGSSLAYCRNKPVNSGHSSQMEKHLLVLKHISER